MTGYMVLVALLAFVTGGLFKMGALYDSGVMRMYAWFGVMAIGLAATGALLRWQRLSGLRELDRALAALPPGFTQLEFGRQAWDLWRQQALAGGPAADPEFEPPAELVAATCDHGPPAASPESNWPPGWTRERMLGVKTPPPDAVLVTPGGVAVIYTEDLPNHWRGRRAQDRLEVAANKALLGGTLLGTIVERLFPYRSSRAPIGIFPIVVLTRREAPKGQGGEAITMMNPEQLPAQLETLSRMDVMHERERGHLVALLGGRSG